MDKSNFTSVDDQAGQIIEYVQENLGGHLDCAYGLSLGGKILSRMLERDEIVIGHAEGSRAFNRYREIDLGMKQDLVKILENKKE